MNITITAVSGETTQPSKSMVHSIDVLDTFSDDDVRNVLNHVRNAIDAHIICIVSEKRSGR